tara:strand:- start:8219 stop:9187 length:969 start_codon:yes stop_codon:yes gene_type:complete
MSVALSNVPGELHAEIAAYLDMVDEGRRAGRPAPHELPVAQARAEFEAASRSLPPFAPPCTVEQVSPQVRHGHLAARLYRPEQAGVALPVLIYLHGGGYCIGSLDSHDAVCRQLTISAQCAVLALDYRLAPEHPFPAALEDVRDTWDWLQEGGLALGLDPARVALGGDSAGATLASVVCAELAATQEAKPCAQLLFYPAVDARQTSESQELFAEGHLLESATLAWFYQHYAEQPAQRRDWRCSPLLAEGQLRGSAPALLLIAEFDPLLDEGLAYAEHLREQGVVVQSRLCRGMTHDFLRMAGLVPEVLEHYEQAAAFLRRYW